jgi:hypothetical protein
MMNWEGCGRKLSCPVLRCYPVICLIVLSKTTKKSVSLAGLLAKNRTREKLLNTKLYLHRINLIHFTLHHRVSK